MNNRVLIVGASGFVGRHLVRRLSAAPSTSVAGTFVGARAPTGDLNCKWIRLDVCDREQIRSAVNEQAPTHIFYLAAVSSVQQAATSPDKAWAVNFGGVATFLWAVRDLLPTARIIFCSSAEAYGRSLRSDNQIDETSSLHPETLYGSTKAAADVLVRQAAKEGLRTIVVRPFNHTGPGQSEDFVIPSFASQLAAIERGEKSPEIHVGDLSVRRDFLDVRDVVSAYEQLIKHFDDLPNGSVLNIASGLARSLDEVLRQLIELSRINVTIITDPSRVRGNPIPTFLGNAYQANKYLKWGPKYAWEQTLSSVLDYWRAIAVR